jgi:hypothetical protein
MGDNIEFNSHVGQMRSTYEADHHIVDRGNVAYNHGSYGMPCGGIDNVCHYNNTSFRLNQLGSWNAPVCGYNDESGNYSLDSQNVNNLYADNGDGPPILGDSSGNTVTSSNNLCFLTGAHAHGGTFGQRRISFDVSTSAASRVSDSRWFESGSRPNRGRCCEVGRNMLHCDRRKTFVDPRLHVFSTEQ